MAYEDRMFFHNANKLAAVILIEDPLRDEAPSVIKRLKEAGFEDIVMMTGDSERTAKSVAEKTGVTRYFSEVLPEDKADFIRRARSRKKGNHDR